MEYFLKNGRLNINLLTIIELMAKMDSRLRGNDKFLDKSLKLTPMREGENDMPRFSEKLRPLILIP